MYLMSFESEGVGDNNDNGYHPPTIGVYTSLERMYKDFCEYVKDDNYDVLYFGYNKQIFYHFEPYTRSQFLDLISKGGMRFNDLRWVKFSPFQTNKLKNLGEWRSDGTGIKAEYVQLEHEYLETSESKTCIYKNLDLDGQQYICGADSYDHGYCQSHHQIYERLFDNIEFRIDSIDITEEQESEFRIFCDKFLANKIINIDLIKEIEAWEAKTNTIYTKPITEEKSIKPITSETIKLIPEKILKKTFNVIPENTNFYLYLHQTKDFNMLYVFNGPIYEKKLYKTVGFRDTEILDNYEIDDVLRKQGFQN